MNGFFRAPLDVNAIERDALKSGGNEVARIVLEERTQAYSE